jgi:hypothetical protein
MPFLICSECNGYYELEEGESADDFENCHCGGKLNFNSQLILEEINNSDFNEEPQFICPHCFEKSFSGIFCSKCGSDLISIGNSQIAESISQKYNQKKAEIDSKYLKPKVKKEYKRKSYAEREIQDSAESNIDTESNEKIPLSQKISLFSILVGAVSAGIVFLLTFVIFGLGLDILGYLLFIIPGALAAFLSQKIKYSYGVINATFSGILAVLILFVGCFLIHSYLSAMFAVLVIVSSPIIIFLMVIGGMAGIYLRIKSEINKQDIELF